MNILHILVPTVRREYIGKIAESIYQAESHKLDIRLHISYQWDKTFSLGKGLEKINELMLMVDSGWIWILSDDNKINPKFFNRLTEAIESNPKAECIVFSQERRDPETRILHANKHSMFSSEIDGTQFVIKKEFIGNRIYDYAKYKESCDGHFIEEIYHSGNNKEKFVFIDEVLTTFNSYFWEKP